MKKTGRFILLREKSLDKLFTTGNLSSIWRGIVRSQMRSLDILDLHDYYDFNLSITEKAKEIRNQILKAQYKASSPLIYRFEKRYGICRHIMIPSPSDALVFQTITEHLFTLVRKAQPTGKAYYSRDKHHLKLPHQFKATGAYTWSYLWPKFQKDIWKFTNECAFLVVTDITDFFDNIGLRELRHIVSSKIKVEEVILDLLFNIIEQLSWIPDYLPTSLKGLPTINLEAFRLLPHVMLFEMDEVLNIYSKGNFVRWMDDINIGVDSKDKAFEILGNINDLLKSRGLALSIAKTEVYTSDEAKEHFFVGANMYLDDVHKINHSDPDFTTVKAEFINHFKLHLTKFTLKNWDKVTKRYFTEAGRLKIAELRKFSYELFMNYPSIRRSILLYLYRLGFSKINASFILKLMRDVKRYDDVTLFDFCKLITDIEIPRTQTAFEFIKNIDKTLSQAKSDFDLYCYIWFLAKYGEPYRLMNLIQKTNDQWRNEHFLARQVVSVMPRLLKFNKEISFRLLDEQMTAGPRDAASVATNIQSLFATDRVVKNLYAYLFPPKPQKPYPLPKYLILMAVLSSESLKKAEKTRITLKVKDYITDRWYLHWLRKYGLID